VEGSGNGFEGLVVILMVWMPRIGAGEFAVFYLGLGAEWEGGLGAFSFGCSLLASLVSAVADSHELDRRDSSFKSRHCIHSLYSLHLGI